MKRHYYFKVIFLCFIGILIFSTVTAYSAEESITLTTYYPSPYGVYSEMRLYPKGSADCSSDLHIGVMYYKNSPPNEGLNVCGKNASGGYEWKTLSGYWSLSSNNLYATNTTAWNVGIGTNNPGVYRLRVNGDMRVDGNVSWSGNLTSGGVPWQRLNSFPAACPSGQYVRGVGGTLTCDSAIRRINGMSGPNINIVGVGNITVSNAGNTVTIGSSGGGGGGGGNITINGPGGAATGSVFNFIDNGGLLQSGNTFTFSGGGGGGYWAPSGSNIYNTNGGNVGVGTAGPSQKLEVTGNIKAGRFTIVDTMYGGGPYYPAVGTDGTNTGVASGPGGNFYVLNSAGSYGNTYGNDYWVQAANGGAGAWASSLGGGGGGAVTPWFSPVYAHKNGGDGTYNLGSPGQFKFCALGYHWENTGGGGDDASCGVALSGTQWTLTAQTGTDADVKCQAICF